MTDLRNRDARRSRWLAAAIAADLLLVVDPGDWRELQGQPLPLPLQQAWYQGYVAA